jgi:hypothetical protein
MLTVGLTGCSNSKRKPFEYKEWHNVQINEYGEKCTYTSPQRDEFEQKFRDGIGAIVGGTLRAVGLSEKKCYTLAQWRAVEQGTAEMMGLLNSFRSIQGKSSLGTFDTPSNTPSFNSSAPSGYTNSFGNTYQYNLSNPGDRIRYNSDPGAQLRDRVTPNPYKNIELNTLQQGGGIYPTNNSPTWTPVE